MFKPWQATRTGRRPMNSGSKTKRDRVRSHGPRQRPVGARRFGTRSAATPDFAAANSSRWRTIRSIPENARWREGCASCWGYRTAPGHPAHGGHGRLELAVTSLGDTRGTSPSSISEQIGLHPRPEASRAPVSPRVASLSTSSGR